MYNRTVINSKNNELLSQLLSGNKKCERVSNPLPKPLYPYTSGLAYLVNFTTSNKQLSNVISVFRSLDHVSSL